MKSSRKLAWLVFVIAMGCRSQAPTGPVVQTGTPVPNAPSHTVNLDQGWSEEQQQRFWFTSQGSQMVPYDWFLALEQPTSTDLIRSDANLDRLGYLVETPSPANPDGLPVGFAKDLDPETGAWMGFTCAACHTNQIDTPTARLRIDGGPTLADAYTFFDQIAKSLQATATDDQKFDRFAHKVLGQGYTPAAASALRQRLQTLAQLRVARQNHDSPPVAYGHGRLDAFGDIFNQVLGADLNIPENFQKANAPVSYPFLWDTSQSDRVQWNGVAPNAGAGALARNVGEILGVFGTVTVEPVSKERKELKGYKSSAKIASLGELEATLNDLWSPLWPAEYLPPLDPAKVRSGQAIYQQQCASCHAVIERTDPKRRLNVVMTPVAELGTDPTMVENSILRAGRTGPLQGDKVLLLAGPPFGDRASGVQILDHVVLATIVGQKGAAAEAVVKEFIDVKNAPTFDPRSYKARSLNGIWATAPYLHNGSVPNLWELMKPSAQRVQQFHVGSRQYDAVNVGFDTASGASLFDTRLPGNSNAGHDFGTNLSDEQKWALIEYMKSL
jgi:hypothetical protein